MSLNNTNPNPVAVMAYSQSCILLHIFHRALETPISFFSTLEYLCSYQLFYFMTGHTDKRNTCGIVHSQVWQVLLQCKHLYDKYIKIRTLTYCTEAC